MMRRALLSLLILFAAAPAFAQSRAPLEIEADNQLEWLRDKNMYRGTGNVMIKQGDSVIRGDMAEAYYDGAVGPEAMTHMIVTGKTVTLTTPSMKVIAHDRMTYNVAEKKATASGGAEVAQPTQKLKADTITAWISPETGKMQRAEANGHVMITRQSKDGVDIAQAQKAKYNAEKNIIDLQGNVKITRGTNHMEGQHATVDLNTGASTLKNTGGGGRVRAVFTPGAASAPMPSITTAPIPTINSKKKFEQPYAVGVKVKDDKK